MFLNKYGTYVKPHKPCSKYPENKTLTFDQEHYEVICEGLKEEELKAEALTESSEMKSMINIFYLIHTDIKFSLGNYCRGWANCMDLKNKDY